MKTLFICLAFFSGCCLQADPSGSSNFNESAVLFTGNANIPLAKEIADYLEVPLGVSTVTRFNDGEISIQIEESVRNKDVFIVQSNCPTETQSINDNLMELYLLVRTVKRASANSITAIIPYYGYARQDRKTHSRVPISAADVALMLEVAGVDRVVTIDLHCGQIQGFFQYAPVDNLHVASMFASYFSDKMLDNVVIVSPDAGGVERAREFQDSLAKRGVLAELAIICKQRLKAGVIGNMQLIGNVKDADVIIIDDICDTGGTLVQAAQLLKDHGANRVFTAIVHPVFSGAAIDKIRHSVIEEMVVTNTIPLRTAPPENLKTLSVAPLLGEAIKRIQMGGSLSELFR